MLTTHCLGTGSFATVHLGMDASHSSYKQVACKIIKKKKDQKIEKLMKEVRILTGLNHVCYSIILPEVILMLITLSSSQASIEYMTLSTTTPSCTACRHIFRQ